MLRHVGDQLIKHASLAEQGLGARLEGVGFKQPGRIEALPDGAEQDQQCHGERTNQKQQVAFDWLAEAGG